MKIKGAIFDMDGTIVDSLMFWDYLWERIGTEYMNDPAFRPCDEVNKKVRTMIYTEAMEYFRAYYKLSVSPEEFFTFASSGVHDFYVNVSRIKGNADKLLEYLTSTACDFFTAPASTRFHGSYPGGLCEHSLNVYDCLCDYMARDRVREEYGLDYSEESIAIVALLHDLCKTNFYVESTRNVKEDGVWKTVPYYTI